MVTNFQKWIYKGMSRLFCLKLKRLSARAAKHITGYFWFKFNNLRLTLGMTLKFYNSVATRVVTNFRKILEVILTFVEVTGGKVGLLTPIVNKINIIVKECNIYK